MAYILIFITAIFVNNIVLSQFLGICPFLGVSKKVDSALGMGAAVAFVLTIILKKSAPALYQALGVFLPLITTNCCILGVAILVAQGTYATQGLEPNLLTGVVFAVSTALGFALALIVFAGIREQLSMMDVPKGMQGMSIALVTAGLLAMAFMGFSGVDNGLKTLFGL